MPDFFLNKLFWEKRVEKRVKNGLTVTQWCSECKQQTVMNEYGIEIRTYLVIIPYPEAVQRLESFLKCEQCETTYEFSDERQRVAEKNRRDDQEIMSCIKCGRKMRIPLVGKTLEVTCPHCKAKLICESDD